MLLSGTTYIPTTSTLSSLPGGKQPSTLSLLITLTRYTFTRLFTSSAGGHAQSITWRPEAKLTRNMAGGIYIYTIGHPASGRRNYTGNGLVVYGCRRCLSRVPCRSCDGLARRVRQRTVRRRRIANHQPATVNRRRLRADVAIEPDSRPPPPPTCTAGRRATFKAMQRRRPSVEMTATSAPLILQHICRRRR